MRYFTDSPFERLMMEVPHGHSLAAEAVWRHEQQATGKPAAFSLPSERRSSLNSTLIIAEKPSVALAIAAVVGADKRKKRLSRRKRLSGFLVRRSSGFAGAA